jgi:PDZ domain-containing protein
VEVFDVQHGGAADGVLAVGDVITAVDGRPVTADTDLSGAIDRAEGAAVTLAVHAVAGAERTVSLTPRRSPDGTRWLLGVVIGPANPQVRLQIPVTVDAGNVEGPSAGLMTALTVYDMLSPVDVAAGRAIAGTGTLAVDGTVGDIGGIEAKARAAEAAGADLFLAPADQAQAARAVLGDRVPVVGVATFADALSALGAG